MSYDCISYACPGPPYGYTASTNRLQVVFQLHHEDTIRRAANFKIGTMSDKSPLLEATATRKPTTHHHNEVDTLCHATLPGNYRSLCCLAVDAKNLKYRLQCRARRSPQDSHHWRKGYCGSCLAGSTVLRSWRWRLTEPRQNRSCHNRTQVLWQAKSRRHSSCYK